MQTIERSLELNHQNGNLSHIIPPDLVHLCPHCQQCQFEAQSIKYTMNPSLEQSFSKKATSEYKQKVVEQIGDYVLECTIAHSNTKKDQHCFVCKHGKSTNPNLVQCVKCHKLFHRGVCDADHRPRCKNYLCETNGCFENRLNPHYSPEFRATRYVQQDNDLNVNNSNDNDDVSLPVYNYSQFDLQDVGIHQDIK